MAHRSAAQPFISLNDVSIRLHGRMLFEHACWRLETDQHWAVLGPNGAGKSVLMKAACGQVGERVKHARMRWTRGRAEAVHQVKAAILSQDGR